MIPRAQVLARAALVAALALAIAAAPAPAETVVLAGATIHPVSGPAIEGGSVVIRDGKIAAVGRDVPRDAAARTIDLTG
ncbi:MAG TPA: amidohydrolase, partial [Candidatus Eisenbacteria bacterium]